MYSQNNVWLENENDVNFRVTYVDKVGLPGRRAIVKIEDSTCDGHLALHMDKTVVAKLIECLQKISLEDMKCESTS